MRVPPTFIKLWGGMIVLFFPTARARTLAEIVMVAIRTSMGVVGSVAFAKIMGCLFL